MTPERILLKLTKRSTPATAAYDTWLAQGYSLADLTNDIIKLAMNNDRGPVTLVRGDGKPCNPCSNTRDVYMIHKD